ncbi:MAG: hypothetical protein AB7F96_07720 [Beijerinckiaceae bacterium]
MATLRRYTLVKTRKPRRKVTPERIVLLALCTAVGGGVFVTMNNPNSTPSMLRERIARSEPILQIPIATQIAASMHKANEALENKRRMAILTPEQIAERKLRAEIEERLAMERREAASQLFAARNVDRMPTASIPQLSSGFQVVRPAAQAPGFREIPKWTPQ